MTKEQLAIKDLDGKARLSLLPGGPLSKVAEVLGYGARKYGDHNWRRGRPFSNYLDAGLRHIHAFSEGEDNDPETGLSHLAHAVCDLLFVLEFNAGADRPRLDDRHGTSRRSLEDDRGPSGPNRVQSHLTGRKRLYGHLVAVLARLPRQRPGSTT